MKVLKYILAFIVLFSIVDSSAQSLWKKADEAYNNKEYSRAIELYKESIQKDGSSSTLLYNLGNAYYRSDSLAQAILCYERALRLDPTNRDALINLEFVYNRIPDKQLNKTDVNDIKSTIDKYLSDTTADYDPTYSTTGPDTLALLAIFAFALFIVAAGFYLLNNRVIIKKVAFFGGIAMLIVTIIFVVLAVKMADNLTRKDMIVVTAESSQLSTTPATPSAPSEQVVLLHEGTKLQVVDSISTPKADVKKWYEVKLDGENTAWIPANDVEII